MLNTCSDNIEDPESLEVSNALEKYTGLKVRLYLFHCSNEKLLFIFISPTKKIIY